jgi:Xaa-Pro aminopeptidase
MSRDNLLIVSNSEHTADMLYAVRMFVPDPFVYLRLRGKCHVVMSDLEIDRARREARHCRVVSLAQCRQQLEAEGSKKPTLALVIRHILKSKRLKRIAVPYHFPLGLAEELRKLKVRVDVKPGPFFPEREFKSSEEVKKISAALMMAEVGLAEGLQALKSSKVGKRRKLLYNNVPLTSEKLRAIIDTAILQAGGCPANTIVAGGPQSCDPHQRGYGPLRAHEPIILDVFPRSQKTGYFGDITRTVIKGRASEAIRKVYHTVERAQEIAFAAMKHQVRGRNVHTSVQSFFLDEGYLTGQVNGRLQGFFHGTGHGLGLEVHESPAISLHSQDVLRCGQVVTVEPGLYYPGLGGGIRLEDVALITRSGTRNLTRFEKVLEV